MLPVTQATRAQGLTYGQATNKVTPPVGSAAAAALKSESKTSELHSETLAPIDDTADEVTRHLLCARSKIEAVEHEFAQIMGELAAYSERIPARSAPPPRWYSNMPAGSPPSGPTKTTTKAGRDMPEYFFVGTPSALREDGTSFSQMSVPMEPVASGPGRRLAESLGE